MNQEIIFYKKNINLYLYYNLNIKLYIINDLYLISLFIKKNLFNNIPFIVDYVYLNTNYLFIIFNTYFFINNFNFIYINKKKVKSINNIYSNSLWLEREIKEFNNIFFFFSKDSRRLLLDYTIKINNNNNNNNNNIFYDINI